MKNEKHKEHVFFRKQDRDLKFFKMMKGFGVFKFVHLFLFLSVNFTCFM